MALLKNNGYIQIPDELEKYFQNKFISDGIKTKTSDENEHFVEFWKDYLKSSDINAFQILKDFYPQLYFPIQIEINKTEDYIDAVLKGKDSYRNLLEQLKLNNVEGVNIKIHQSIAGEIPVLSLYNDTDFVAIVQSFLYKNNPTNIPQSMGAFLAKGINNWARIHSLKKQWMKNNSFGNWNNEFTINILPNPDLYKDKIIVLSTKPYSNISFDKLDLSEEKWKAFSYSIRLEHECVHLYTLKRYGVASNNLHDELIADYIGISKTIGSYNKEWMFLFMGLEEYPKYRKGARLQNYLEDTQLSEENFQKLIGIVKNAIETIADFDIQLGKINSDKDQIFRIEALCEAGILNISSKIGVKILIELYNEKLIANSYRN
jgi:hypothetical protein